MPDVTVTAVGNLVADVDLKFIPSGAAVANLTVASTARTFDKGKNEWVDGSTTFLRCNLWRELAENAAESLKKGSRVVVTGKLRQKSYEKDGEKKSVFEIEVDDIGPSLKNATARPVKAGKSSPKPVVDDPWGKDEVPF